MSKSLAVCLFITLVFIGLRVFGFVDWAWYWLLAPIWIPTIACSVVEFLQFLDN